MASGAMAGVLTDTKEIPAGTGSSAPFPRDLLLCPCPGRDRAREADGIHTQKDRLLNLRGLGPMLQGAVHGCGVPTPALRRCRCQS